MPKIYDLDDLPRRSRLGISAEMLPYVEALRAGKAVGDGLPYDDATAARRVCMKFYQRAQKILALDDDPGISQRVWEEGGGYRWVLIPRVRS